MSTAFIRLYVDTWDITCHQLRLCWQNVYRCYFVKQVVDQCVNKHWPGLIHNRGYVRMIHCESDDFISLSSKHTESKIKIVPLNTGFHIYVEDGQVAYGSTYPFEKLREIISMLLCSNTFRLNELFPPDIPCELPFPIHIVDVISLGEDTTYTLPMIDD